MCCSAKKCPFFGCDMHGCCCELGECRFYLILTSAQGVEVFLPGAVSGRSNPFSRRMPRKRALYHVEPLGGRSVGCWFP